MSDDTSAVDRRGGTMFVRWAELGGHIGMDPDGNLLLTIPANETRTMMDAIEMNDIREALVADALVRHGFGRAMLAFHRWYRRTHGGGEPDAGALS